MAVSEGGLGKILSTTNYCSTGLCGCGYNDPGTSERFKFLSSKILMQEQVLDQGGSQNEGTDVTTELNRLSYCSDCIGTVLFLSCVTGVTVLFVSCNWSPLTCTI